MVTSFKTGINSGTNLLSHKEITEHINMPSMYAYASQGFKFTAKANIAKDSMTSTIRWFAFQPLILLTTLNEPMIM